MIGSGGAGMNLLNRRRPELLSEINVTPMVDVMLVLLIIFIVTGQIVLTGTDVELPDSEESKIVTPVESIEVTIDAQQTVYLGTTPIASEDFADVMLQLSLNSPAPHEQQVLVRADRDLPYGSVIQVVAQISKSGFTKVAFLSNPSLNRPAGDLP